MIFKINNSDVHQYVDVRRSTLWIKRLDSRVGVCVCVCVCACVCVCVCLCCCVCVRGKGLVLTELHRKMLHSSFLVALPSCSLECTLR